MPAVIGGRQLVPQERGEVARLPKQNKLTWVLLKEGIEPVGALRNAELVTEHVVPALTTRRATLFVSASNPHPPWWASYLGQHVRGDLRGLFTASSAAVLFIGVSDRWLAATFGQGRHLLDTDTIESDFGLKVVLNTVDPMQLKSVDAKTIDETTLHTRRDVSRDSPFSAFGLDVSRDLLRAVTGTPADEALGPRLTGSDALGLWTRLPVPDLPDLANRLLVEYASTRYQQNFDFIDFLRQEKSVARIADLNDQLVAALRNRELDDLHLAAPETLDWLDVGGFTFTSNPERLIESDPRISTYLSTKRAADLELADLKSDKMIARRASDGQTQAVWQVYQCLVFETQLDNRLYVLTGGEWFRVQLSFKDTVYDDVRAIPTYAGLPDADSGTDEGTYNLKAAQAVHGICMDKKLVLDGGPDKMELCDVLTASGVFIHVKQRGSSSTLSHLFAQGVNSAERFFQDESFRNLARRLVEAEDPAFGGLIPETRPSPETYEVTFGVITRSRRDTPLTLPFFSLVSLRTAAMRLRGFGFRVSVAEIHEIETDNVH